MKTYVWDIREQLIERLAGGDFVSGQRLAEEFGLSRSAISSHIKALGELGLDLYSVKGKGYRTAKPIQLLNADSIKNHLSQKQHVEVLNLVDSTNDYLKAKQDQLNNGHCVFAEAQTKGRGRQGRNWFSPYGGALLFSCYWHFSQGYQALNGLSLVAGVALAKALCETGLSNVQLKWPNDLYYKDAKLAGILVEVEGRMGDPCHCIIGIGLNLQLPKQAEQHIDQPWSDLRSHAHSIDRNQLAAILVNRLRETLQQFEEQGLAPFIQQWQALDLYANQVVRLLIGDKVVTGTARGIDEQGALLVEHKGETTAYYGGEISVRAQV
jgi:BirA family biotin operon repressor/biotin-[acetyl-CoA-carboxylase] ligase